MPPEPAAEISVLPVWTAITFPLDNCKALVLANKSAPPARVTFPVMELVLASVSVPAPALVKPAVPARLALMVAALPAPSPLTVMVGVVPLRVKVEVSGVPGLKTQPAAVLVTVSPKIRALMLWFPSSVTAESAVMSSVLKSAVSVAPGSAPVLHGGLATVFQLPEALPPESWFQVSVP